MKKLSRPENFSQQREQKYKNSQKHLQQLLSLKGNDHVASPFQQIQVFTSLAGKIITRQKESPFVMIKFPNENMFKKYMKNYFILKQFVKVPIVVYSNQQKLEVCQEFIENKPHLLIKQECEQFLFLIEQIIKIDADKMELPILTLSSYNDVIIENFVYWNRFVPQSQSINEQQLTCLRRILTKISSQIDQLHYKTLYRDLNLTNILRCSVTNELYLIDFQNLTKGPYIVDLAFILSDKYFFFDDFVIEQTITKFADMFSLNRQKVQKDLIKCTFFLNIQWLVQLVSIYYKKSFSFHMNLRVLLVQLLRNSYKMQEYCDKNDFRAINSISLKIFRGFLDGYTKLSTIKAYNLPKLFNRLVLFQAQEENQKNQAFEKVKLHFLRKNKLNVAQVKIEQVICNLKQIMSSKADQLNGNLSESMIMITLLHEILSKSEDFVILSTSKSEIIDFLSQIFPKSLLLSYKIPQNFKLIEEIN